MVNLGAELLRFGIRCILSFLDTGNIDVKKAALSYYCLVNNIDERLLV